MELLAGLIGAVVGFVAKAITDVLTERRRREGEKQARLLEAKLRHALDFMEAAGRLSRSRQRVAMASTTLSAVKDSKDEEAYKDQRARLMEARERADSAFTDAQKAQAAIDLLMPTASSATLTYLLLCNDADSHPDDQRDAREQARQTAEEAIRAAVGA